MLPSLRQFLRFIDCEEKVAKHGFTVKVTDLASTIPYSDTPNQPGGAIKFNQFKKEGCKFGDSQRLLVADRTTTNGLFCFHRSHQWCMECGASCS